MPLFALGSETVSRPIPLSAAILAQIQMFRERVAMFMLSRSRNHVVLCGLGQRGIQLVQDLHSQGEQVVVIERQEDHPDLIGCRAPWASLC